MLRALAVVTLLAASAGTAGAHGLLIPEEKSVPPLAMVNHRVTISLEDQVAVTRVEQVFRNHTERALEATYVFPVPRGASVNDFSMWVGGKEVRGEMVEAAKARHIYEDIVRRTQDPGLLEYMGNNLLRMRVFPIAPRSDQKVAVRYTAVAQRDAGVVEYIYPLKTDGRATAALEDFAITATIKSQHPILNVYSPTHALSTVRSSDHEMVVKFERNQGLLDKDFQLFYATGDKDIGFTALTHRPVQTEKGFFLFLIAPRVELPKEQTVPRDMVLILDTSGSMRGPKMDQARRALKYCLENLAEGDRFALLNFATTVNRYRDGLTAAGKEQVEQAKKWVDGLEATGGTAIDDALASALELRGSDAGRTFTVVFFTDGQPTIGETNPEKILAHVTAKNTASTRIFTFGVGDDVNATLLDQLADQTRAVSSYVRPAEDIEAKVSSLYAKISHPVLANLKLTASSGVRFEEVYPPQLPDLFHGGQVVVLGRFTGQGPAAATLSGMVGKELREFTFELNFPEKTRDDKGFVEHLWARRKVGYLLDQIRANGEKKELVEETVALAKRYGIATPYTSYLIVPDAPVPVARGQFHGGMPGMRDALGQGVAGPIGQIGGGGGGIGGGGMQAMMGRFGGARGAEPKVAEIARAAKGTGTDGLAVNRARVEDARLSQLSAAAARAAPTSEAAQSNLYSFRALQEAGAKKRVYDEAQRELGRRNLDKVQAGKLGVELSIDANSLRNQVRLTQTAVRLVNGRTCLELGGIWIDEGFEAKTPAVEVKAMSAAYFRILERHPEMKEVFRLGNHLVWVAPSGNALVIDTGSGKETLSDAEIDGLFASKQ